MDSLYPDTAKGIAVMWAQPMADYIKRLFESTQRNIDIRNMFCMSSDYMPFMLEGIATARPAAFNDPFPPQSHTILDTPDRVPMDWIRQNAMTYALMMVSILLDPKPLPTKRLTKNEVLERLRKEDALEAWRLFDFDI